jgi:hypothetical protein
VSVVRLSLVFCSIVGCGPSEGEAVLNADLNYSFGSTISADSQLFASGQDAVVDWSALSVDQLGKPMSPDEIDQLLIVRFEALSRQEVLDKAAEDCLQQRDITGVVEVFPEAGEAQANLSDFQLIGYQVDPEEQFQEGLGTFLLSAYTDGVPGVRMLSFLEPSASSDNLDLYLKNESASIVYSVDLSVGERLPSSTTAIDWAQLAVPTECGSFAVNKYDWLMLAHYESAGLTDLEDDFLRVDELATEIWNADIEGRSTYDLLTLVSDEGKPFTGFTDQGIWILALRCTTCSNPAPPFLTIVSD